LTKELAIMIYSVELDSELISDFQKILKENGESEKEVMDKIIKNYIENENKRKNKKILDDGMEFLDKKMDEHIDVLKRLCEK